MAIGIGTKLGRYEIHSQLGAGGMGEVYLVQDTKLMIAPSSIHSSGILLSHCQ
jgi:serine/threonine protein kinase